MKFWKVSAHDNKNIEYAKIDAFIMLLISCSKENC
jgi:hypothetical protein